MATIAIYGGSFNPPHIGHALVAAWLRWTDQTDTVVLLPSFAHPFRKELAPFDRRVALCRALGRAVGPWVEVSAIEAELPAPSYTVDVLAALEARRPGDRLRLVVGADLLPDLPKWRRWDEIAARWDPIVVGRAGYDSPADTLVFPQVSATDVRARLAAGASVAHLLPREVLAELGDLYRVRSTEGS